MPGPRFRLRARSLCRRAIADILYTDTWVSMGRKAEKAQRLGVFRPYQINAELLATAPKHAVVMHCLPAYAAWKSPTR